MRLTDSFVDLIAYVSYFLKTVATKQPPFEQVQADIQRLLSESEAHVAEASFSRDDYDLARFAVFAWIDEAIMSSSWKEKNKWLGVQLQRRYYKTAEAGELFFEKLNMIGPHQRDVREVYYLCLAMGFSGRYINQGDDYLLEQLKSSNVKLLIGSSMGLSQLEKGNFFPEAYFEGSEPMLQPKRKGGFSFTTLLGICFPIVFFAVLFLVYRFILGNIGENILNTVP